MKTDFAVAAIAVLIFLGSVIGAHEVGWSRGTKAAEAAATAREEGINADHLEALATATQRERDAETKASNDLAEQANSHRKEMEDERKKRDRFAADVRSGAVRLSIPIVSSSAHCSTAAGADAATGSATRPEARAELAPQTGIDLAAIADDGDDAIRQLNQCIDAYNTVKDRYNGMSDAQAR